MEMVDQRRTDRLADALKGKSKEVEQLQALDAMIDGLTLDRPQPTGRRDETPAGGRAPTRKRSFLDRFLGDEAEDDFDALHAPAPAATAVPARPARTKGMPPRPGLRADRPKPGLKRRAEATAIVFVLWLLLSAAGLLLLWDRIF